MLLEPLQNAVSRRFERQCDRYALERTGLKDAYLSAFRKLARLNKDDPQPALARRAAVPQPSAGRRAAGDGGGITSSRSPSTHLARISHHPYRKGRPFVA